MRILRRKSLGILGVSVAGMVLGGLTGFWCGRAMLMRAARVSLSDYAQQLTEYADGMNRELALLFRQIKTSAVPYCSNREIAELQAWTFHSRDVKDVGRTRDGKLDCSAFLGRLGRPYVEGQPTVELPNGMNIYTRVPVVMASLAGEEATVIEAGGVDVVLSPTAFDHWDRPHTQYMIAVVERGRGRIVPIAGAALPMPSDLVFAQDMRVAAGVLYRSRCSSIYPVCVVTGESVADIWGWSRATLGAYVICGCLAGFSFGLALALLYLQTSTISYQLHRALRNNAASLGLVYQPIVEITTGRCIGVEALIRWKDQAGTAISPEVFVRVAEEKGYIGALTEFVLRRATLELGGFLREHPEMTLSINVAAADMNGSQLSPLLEKHVHLAGIHPWQIALELTERSTADVALVKTSIHRLCGKGYKVHIDDFGTGFSSLSYIDQLAVNAIKIDRAFTRAIGTDAVTAPILPQILAMADSLGLDVIVEGVETEEQKAYLEATGKRMQLQGWIFSRPMKAEAFLKFCGQNAASLELEQEAMDRRNELVCE